MSANRSKSFNLAPRATSANDKRVIVPDLPDSSSPGLLGSYRHALKNLVIGPDDKLYVDIASAMNAHPIDTTSNPVRSAIYQYDLDGANGKIFARGIRNAEYTERTRPDAFRSELRNQPGLEQISGEHVYAY